MNKEKGNENMHQVCVITLKQQENERKTKKLFGFVVGMYTLTLYASPVLEYSIVVSERTNIRIGCLYTAQFICHMRSFMSSISILQ